MKKLKEYIIELQAMVQEHGDLPLYTADDDEGNGYTAVYYSPEVCYTAQAKHRLDEVYCEDEIEYAETALIPIAVLN